MTQERTMPEPNSRIRSWLAENYQHVLIDYIGKLRAYAQSGDEALARAEERVKELEAKYLSAIGADSNV